MSNFIIESYYKGIKIINRAFGNENFYQCIDGIMHDESGKVENSGEVQAELEDMTLNPDNWTLHEDQSKLYTMLEALHIMSGCSNLCMTINYRFQCNTYKIANESNFIVFWDARYNRWEYDQKFCYNEKVNMYWIIVPDPSKKQ